MKELNIDFGGGKRRLDLENKWTIMDISNYDIFYDFNSMKSFPLEDNSVDNYYSSMALEHLNSTQIEFILKEIYRTLKPNGLFRIVVPDIEVGIKWYLEDSYQLRLKRNPAQDDKKLRSTKLGKLIGWFFTSDKQNDNKIINGHRMAFDFETLNLYLFSAGFKNIVKSSFSKGSSIFMNKDYPRYKDYGLYVECSKLEKKYD